MPPTQQAFAAEPGVIINIASVGGMRTEFGLGVYNLTKAALIHLTRQLANELGPTRVVGIAPGLVKTDFAKVLVDNFGESARAQPADQAARRAGGHRQPRRVPRLRQGVVDHRRDLRDRRRRRRARQRRHDRQLIRSSTAPSAASTGRANSSAASTVTTPPTMNGVRTDHWLATKPPAAIPTALAAAPSQR